MPTPQPTAEEQMRAQFKQLLKQNGMMSFMTALLQAMMDVGAITEAPTFYEKLYSAYAEADRLAKAANEP